MKLGVKIGIIVCVPLMLEAQMSLKERSRHFGCGSAKLAFLAANLYMMGYSAVAIHQDMQTLAPALRKWVFDGKISQAKWDMFRQGITFLSCSYAAQKSLKSCIYSFRKAFERETIIKREIS